MPPLKLHDPSFGWSGLYSDGARQLAAQQLVDWMADQNLQRPDFFAHSHGGTVANLATRRGLEFDRLVLLSWPVHEQWFPDFNRVGRVIDVRVRLDLIILADRRRPELHPATRARRQGHLAGQRLLRPRRPPRTGLLGRAPAAERAVSTAGSAKLLAVGAAWRLTGVGAAGRTLVRAAAAPGERADAGRHAAGAGRRPVGTGAVPRRSWPGRARPSWSPCWPASAPVGPRRAVPGVPTGPPPVARPRPRRCAPRRDRGGPRTSEGFLRATRICRASAALRSEPTSCTTRER